MTVRTTSGPGPLDGIAIGARANGEAIELLPEIARGRAIVILASSTCGPCREVMAELRTMELSVPAVLLLPGPVAAAQPLLELVPSWIRLLRDPEANQAATELQVNRTPFVFLFEEGRVRAKRAVKSAREVSALIDDAPAEQMGTTNAPTLFGEVGHGS
jgi:hypothetical protein